MAVNNTKIPNNTVAYIIRNMNIQPLLYLVVLLYCLGAVADSLGPYMIKLVIDALPTYAAEMSLFTFVPLLIFISVKVASLALWRIGEFIQAYASPSINRTMRLELVNYVSRHSHSFFTENFTGSIAQKVENIREGFNDLYEYISWMLTMHAIQVLVSITSIYFTDSTLGIYALVWFIVYIVVGVYLLGIQDRLYRKQYSVQAIVSGNIVDNISNSDSVRLFAAHEFERKHIKNVTDIEYTALKKTWFFGNCIRLFNHIMTNGFRIGSVCYGIILYSSGMISVGDVALIMFAGQIIGNSGWELSEMFLKFTKDYSKLREALEYLIVPYGITDKKDARELVVKNSSIHFDNISFSYGDRKIFNNFSLLINQGEKVGLVGLSGSGKTTLIKLLLRQYDIDGGSILIDNNNIKDITQDSLRGNIGLIPQDTAMFCRSIFDNIQYGKNDATREEVIAASKAAHAHEFIIGLPDGYETTVGERGVKLSGGQRQRIAIARAILKNAPILILDEATSALDSESESYIQDSLSKILEGKTSIVIAHRLSTIMNMDRIIVMEDGRIIEEGTHSALIEQGEKYAKLFSIQSNGFLG
jgi:ATP-binding cassette, subfamily B, bacterial